MRPAAEMTWPPRYLATDYSAGTLQCEGCFSGPIYVRKGAHPEKPACPKCGKVGRITRLACAMCSGSGQVRNPPFALGPEVLECPACEGGGTR